MRDMQGNLMGDYCVDIVMCIDLTRSMRNYIEEVKRKAIVFHELFIEAMDDVGHEVAQLRIRVIGFRDFGYGAEPIVDSGRFFMLPDENKEFERFVLGLQVDTGGDIPESSLEAIALAMKSDWTNEGSKLRHVVLMFTDAPAHPLGFGSDSARYPKGMPSDLAELGSWWQCGVPNGTYDKNAGRLVVFAPEAYPWNEMRGWNRYWHEPSKAGAGLDGLALNDVFDVLVGSL